jgi:hypothetical protein
MAEPTAHGAHRCTCLFSLSARRGHLHVSQRRLHRQGGAGGCDRKLKKAAKKVFPLRLRKVKALPVPETFEGDAVHLNAAIAKALPKAFDAELATWGLAIGKKKASLEVKKLWGPVEEGTVGVARADYEVGAKGGCGWASGSTYAVRSTPTGDNRKQHAKDGARAMAARLRAQLTEALLGPMLKAGFPRQSQYRSSPSTWKCGGGQPPPVSERALRIARWQVEHPALRIEAGADASAEVKKLVQRLRKKHKDLFQKTGDEVLT